MEKKEEDGRKKNVWVHYLVDTSLDTHIGMSLSPTTTVGQLKRDFAKEHPICFPSIGGIKVNGIMVKRKSRYYRLPDWTILKDFFHDWKRPHLHVDAIPLDGARNPCQSERVATEERQVNSVCDDFDSRKPEDQVACEDGAREGGEGEDFRSNRIAEKNQTHEHMKRNEEMCSSEQMVPVNKVTADNTPLQEKSFECGMNQQGQWRPPTAVDAPSLSMSEVASVTGLINRYFPDSDKVESAKCHSHSETGSCASYHGSLKKPRKRKRRSVHKSDVPQCSSSRTPARLFSFLSSADGASKGRREGPQVGKRLLAAANCASASNKKSPIALRKLSSSSVDHQGALVFEISDSVLSVSGNGVPALG